MFFLAALAAALFTAKAIVLVLSLPYTKQAWSRLAGRPSARSARIFEQYVRSSTQSAHDLSTDRGKSSCMPLCRI